MSCATTTSDFLQFGKSAHRILVLESGDIAWLGLRRFVEALHNINMSIMRVTSVDALDDTTQYYRPTMLLFTSLNRRNEILPLLHQLSKILRDRPRLPVVAFLKQDIPYLAELLMAFGVTTLFRQCPSAEELKILLTSPRHCARQKRVKLLTQHECNVAIALLSGYNLSRAALAFDKDVRTISAQKKSIIRKLSMSHAGELQVLGGRLMTLEQGALYDPTI